MTFPASLAAYRGRNALNEQARYIDTLTALPVDDRSKLKAFAMTALRSIDALAPLHAPTDPVCDDSGVVMPITGRV